MTILDTLAQLAKSRCEAEKQKVSLEEMQAMALALPEKSFTFEKALRGEDIRFICEVKKASPSKGMIAGDFPYLQIAKDYEAAGAAAVSVLTEPEYFKGSNRYVEEISREIHLPIIRKDFTVDEYMIYEAKMLGASAVLLIVAILSEEQLKKYLGICDELGLTALVETHDEEEVKTAVSIGARVIGVNNRNLKDFSVDTSLALRLREQIPKEAVYVSESGVKDAEDIRRIREAGADAVLIVETLMRAADKKQMLQTLRG